MGTSNVKALPAKPRKRNSEEIAYRAAIVSGLYASVGRAILGAKNHEYSGALKNARRVVDDQTAELLRGRA